MENGSECDGVWLQSNQPFLNYASDITFQGEMHNEIRYAYVYVEHLVLELSNNHTADTDFN